MNIYIHILRNRHAELYTAFFRLCKNRFLATPQFHRCTSSHVSQRVHIYYHYGIRSPKTIPTMVFGTLIP